MPQVNENSKRSPRGLAIVLAFLVTCLAHAVILFIAARVLRDAGAIAWTLEWTQAGVLGVLAVTWRMWLRQRP